MTFTESVLHDVRAERQRQDDLWGQQDLPNGTGPLSQPLLPLEETTADFVELAFKARERRNVRAGTLTYADVLMEEVAEVMAESNPEKLREELIQAAAVCVKWAEAIDRAAIVQANEGEHYGV